MFSVSNTCVSVWIFKKVKFRPESGPNVIYFQAYALIQATMKI